MCAANRAAIAFAVALAACGRGGANYTQTDPARGFPGDTAPLADAGTADAGQPDGGAARDGGPASCGPNRADLVDKAIHSIEAKLGSSEVRATFADFIRLLQLQKELQIDRPQEIKVTWIDSSKTESFSEE